MANRPLSGTTVCSTAIALLVLLACATVPVSGVEPEARLRVAPGEWHRVSFDTDASASVLVWVRARIALPSGEAAGDHVLQLMLDGMPLKAEAIRVLNKTALFDLVNPDTPPTPLYDSGKEAWFLKADCDTTAYNSRVTGAPYNQPGWAVLATRAYFTSHVYEYLFLLEDIEAGKHVLELGAKPAAGQTIVIDNLRVHRAETPFVLSALDWMQEVFPWQAPTADSLLDNPLRVSGCPGEYEPVTFSLFALKDLPEVDVRVGALRPHLGPLPRGEEDEAPDAVPGQRNGKPFRSETSIFSVRTLKRDALGEAGFIARLPFVPQAWERHSPELLIPLREEKPTVPQFGTQRFYVDVKIPGDAAPGLYRGSLELSSGEQPLGSVPIELEVLPITLADSPADYWMWRLTWSPVWQPENVACLRDIAEHGYTGLARACGAGFKFSIDPTGAVQVDTSAIEKFADVLRQTGLALETSHTGVAGNLLGVICKHLGLEFSDMPQQLPLLEQFFRERLAGQEAISQAETLLENTRPELLEGAGDEDSLEGLADDLLVAETPAQRDKRIAAAAKQKAEETRAEIEALAVQGFRKVKQACDDLGLTLYVFPIDEPCGTPWKRRWTAYAARLAKLGGMETFSTRNNWTWNAHIDHGAGGGMINTMYQAPKLVSGHYRGDLRIPQLPLIGAFRDGAKYHFKGELDEVRIYDRALTEGEILTQHETPAEAGLLGYYPFEEQDGSRSASAPDAGAERLPVPSSAWTRDQSGNGNHAKLIGEPSFVEGVNGQAVSLNGLDQHLQPLPNPNMPTSTHSPSGWSISLWARGAGCLFGRGYEFYTEGARSVRFTTTEQDKEWFTIGGKLDRRFWSHVTLVFDPPDHRIRAFVHDRTIRDWHRENVRWNYMQVRSMPPKNPRYKTGVMAWFYANHGALKNITTFCYDWNVNHLYVVYPRHGEMFNEEGTWYRTVGWEGCREGIDDARYLQTLVRVLEEKHGLTRKEAVEEVKRRFEPLTVSYRGINKVITELGGYGAMRRRIVAEILKEL